MKLEDQVTSLELSKRLKELGVKQESLFRWGQETEDTYIDGKLYKKGDWTIRRNNGSYGFSAFTVAELGEMLPKELNLNGKATWVTEIEKSEERQFIERQELLEKKKIWEYVVYYYAGNRSWDKNEANARAKLLIDLLENVYLSNNKELAKIKND